MSDWDAGVADALAAITSALVTDPDGGAVAPAGERRVRRRARGGRHWGDGGRPARRLELVAASDERSRFVELLQSQIERGPCVDCVRDGAPGRRGGPHR